jgi:zinc transporter ZupT
MWTIKIISLLLILSITLVAGFYPFFKKLKTKQSHAFPIGESLAAGVFLGAGLIHMLGDAAQDFDHLHFDYPIAFLLAGTTFLLLLLLEHIGREMYKKRGASNGFAILATLMLSIHSFLAGAALGLSGSFSVVILILLAILAHKWAASFALSVQINKSQLNFKAGAALFAIFSLMVPLGILCGASATHALANYPLIAPIFSSLAAGTFLYLGTLHGLERAVLVKKCCNLKQYSFVMLGFIIMAVVAIWT